MHGAACGQPASAEMRHGGVQSTVTDPRGEQPATTTAASITLFAKARAVVVAAGALHTPALLLRSGVRGRGHTGRHLRLHPATVALGFFEGRSGGVLRCCTFREFTLAITGFSALVVGVEP